MRIPELASLRASLSYGLHLCYEIGTRRKKLGVYRQIEAGPLRCAPFAAILSRTTVYRCSNAQPNRYEFTKTEQIPLFS